MLKQLKVHNNDYLTEELVILHQVFAVYSKLELWQLTITFAHVGRLYRVKSQKELK